MKLRRRRSKLDLIPGATSIDVKVENECCTIIVNDY